MNSELNNYRPLVLIPVAGFGLRMGSPPAKELLSLRGDAQPLLAEPLNWCRARGWPCLLITRQNKIELNQYLQEYANSYPEFVMQILKIEISSDWQDSLLQSEALWQSHNLVLLPDVEFKPLAVLDQMLRQWDNADVVVATHEVTDAHNWGHFMAAGIDSFSVCEKPTGLANPVSTAWGVFGFKKHIGKELLTAQMHSQKLKQSQNLCGKLKTFKLTSFRDLTRGH